MNETSSPVAVGLLFVLRCLVPLGILFGISYLLRRLEFVSENSDDAMLAEMEEDAAMNSTAHETAGKDSAKKHPSGAKKKAGGKKKSTASKKKEA